MSDAPAEDETGGDDAATATERSPAAIVDDIDRPVLLFDGVCNLCHASIRAIVRLDGEGRLLFAPLQSDIGTELLVRAGMDAAYFDSVVLVEPKPSTATESAGDTKTWTASTKSTAVLRTCRYLDGPVPLLYPLVAVPERVRDAAYDLVATYRYRVFGTKAACTVPDPEIRRRFLERSLA